MIKNNFFLDDEVQVVETELPIVDEELDEEDESQS